MFDSSVPLLLARAFAAVRFFMHGVSIGGGGGVGLSGNVIALRMV